jgi:hypothetical protein
MLWRFELEILQEDIILKSALEVVINKGFRNLSPMQVDYFQEFISFDTIS